jgi:hypothetical protein
MPVLLNIMLRRISAITLILFHFTLDAQINCDNDSSLLIPIVDLQFDTYLGFQGGLVSRWDECYAKCTCRLWYSAC